VRPSVAGVLLRDLEDVLEILGVAAELVDERGVLEEHPVVIVFGLAKVPEPTVEHELFTADFDVQAGGCDVPCGAEDEATRAGDHEVIFIVGDDVDA